ncbi:neutral and basic amino acid transport protein rBAT [Anopheles nili]|uniref:neutral and basic amino acid transport protein rBAT n=1 Tax=Anopheles nili TaxID=185578 RepID=UPI00237A1F21|nr:neutral and basic amino acid transport protein rBAT [Anopheles nili]
MPRENGTGAKEGEDERMLNGGSVEGVAGGTEPTEKDKLAQKEVEVKFIPAQNGDACIDMQMESQQAFSGMTKEELMKYANDPFWVRLRWLLFVLFWALWAAMLLGSFYIIYDAPKCAAPVPLSWWQEGPLVEIDGERYTEQLAEVERFGAKGVIYQLSADETYLVETAAVESKLKPMVSVFRSKNIKLVVDITPNFVTKNDSLFLEALQKPDSAAHAAFVWRDIGLTPPNWLSIAEEGSAWKNASNGQYVLSQFGPERYDLQMSAPAARDKLKGTLRALLDLGVRGIRLANAKHLLINPDGGNESPLALEDADKSLTHTDYGFWTHRETTYREGLGELFRELTELVHEQTAGEGFLSVTEDILRPEVFAVNGTLPIDAPLYGNIEFDLREGTGPDVARKLRHDIANAYLTINEYRALGAFVKPWLQLRYDRASLEHVPASEYTVFHFLLPGVPVFPLDVLTKGGVTHESVEALERFRSSPSFQHGLFNVYNDANVSSIAYTRLKSGNPGYFVVLNLEQDEQRTVDFRGIDGIGNELTVVLTSQNYAVPNVGVKSKVPVEAIPLSPRSALVATYVPTK